MEDKGAGITVNINNPTPCIGAQNLGGTASTSFVSLKEPLRVTWEPKEDISVWELAQCQTLLMTMAAGRVWPWCIDASQSYMRHFVIIDPNISVIDPSAPYQTFSVINTTTNKS